MGINYLDFQKCLRRFRGKSNKEDKSARIGERSFSGFRMVKGYEAKG